MSVKTAAALAGLAFLVTGCGLNPFDQAGTTKPVAKLSDDMAASVFRYQFTHNASTRQAKAEIYCIGYGSNPGSATVFGPSQKLLGLLADVKPHVASYTACTIDPFRGVMEKTTGAPGLLFKIATVSCSTMNRCIVDGGYYEGPLSASANTYFLKRRNRQWVVVGDKDDWLS